MQARQKQEHILNESSSIQNQLKQERSEITDNRTTNQLTPKVNENEESTIPTSNTKSKSK